MTYIDGFYGWYTRDVWQQGEKFLEVNFQQPVTWHYCLFGLKCSDYGVSQGF